MSLPPRAPPLVAYYPTGAPARTHRIADLDGLRWEEHAGNPLIQPPLPSPVIADPTFLPPDQTPDGRWHLFAHSLLGIHHFVSGDGLRWERMPGVIAKNAMRPYLFKDDWTYHLVYENIDRPLALPVLPEALLRWSSHIALRSSTDLATWSAPRVLLRPCLPWHRRGPAASVGNPCLLRVGERYRLYYSAGLVRLADCGFDEPKHIGLAEAETLDGPFVPESQPLLGPSTPGADLGAGSMKVLALEDGFVAFQNGIYTDAEGRSRSAIRTLISEDGRGFRPLSDGPILKPDAGWKRSHVYACDVRWVEDRPYLMFNARSDWRWTRGREAIGLAVGRRG